MRTSARCLLAALALAIPLGASAALVVRAGVSDCGQFSDFNITYCPVFNPGNYSSSSSGSGPASASADLLSEHIGYDTARTSHAGEASAVQGVVHLRSSMVMNVQFEYPSRLGGWTTAGGGWSEMLHNQVVTGIDLPFDIDGGFGWDASGPIGGGASPGKLFVRGRLSVAASLTPQTPGLPFIFDEEFIDFDEAGTIIDESVTLHLRGLQAGADYLAQVFISFQTLLATGGCPSDPNAVCITRARAEGDLMHTARMRAATFYDANGQPITGGLTSESGFDYQKDASDPGGGPGTVPAPATVPLLALALLALAARRRRPRTGS